MLYSKLVTIRIALMDITSIAIYGANLSSGQPCHELETNVSEEKEHAPMKPFFLLYRS